MLGIMGGDKKKIAQLIIGGAKESAKPVNSEVKEDTGAGLGAAMDSLLKAIERKDAQAMMTAFKNAFQLCEMEPHKEYEEEIEDSQEAD